MDRIGSSAGRRNGTRNKAMIESLEARQLLSVAAAASIPNVLANTTTPASNTVDLSDYLTDPVVPGTIATFTFSSAFPIFGKSRTAVVRVALTDNATPITVANFLSYADSGSYNGTFLHRAVDIASGAGSSPSDNATIEQGGGYYVNQANPFSPKIAQIKTNAAIVNEAATETYGNVAGTIAMARTSDVNSATSQWFFNVSDNTDLDESSSNSNSSDTTGYAVFGKILGDGLTTLTTLSKLPSGTISSKLGLTTVPLAGVSEATASTTKAPIGPRNLVELKSVTSQTGVSYTVTSSDPSLVSPLVNGNQLSFRYGSTAGTATITVNANDSYDGSTASETFHVTVPASTTTGTAPVTAADTAATTAVTAVVINPLANDTDAASALNPATLAISTQPASGTATVNTTAGTITYTPAAGFTGTDTLAYTIADAAGNTSTPTPITVSVTAAPVTVSLGSASARSLLYTEPDGTVSRVSVTGGTAVVTFTGSSVTTHTAGGTVTATGVNATIAGIVITNATKQQATLTVSGGRGGNTLGSITDTGAMHALIAPATTLTGALNVGGTLGLLRVASAANAALVIGGTSADQTTIDIPTATNTSLSSGSNLAALRSTSWTVTDGGAHVVSAPGIGTLNVRGAFADGLAITGGTLKTADVRGAVGGNASSAWNVTGTLGNASVGSAASGWGMNVTGNVTSLQVRSGGLASAVAAGGIQSFRVQGDLSAAVTSTGAVGSFHVQGNLTSDLTAASLQTLAVTGSITGSTITTNGSFSKVTTQLRSLRVGGAISNSTINSAGSIGRVSAASLSGSSLLAGILDTTVSAATLPSASTDFANAAVLRSVHLSGTANPAFSDSKIAAQTIDHLSLGTIQNSNAGTPEGVAGENLFTLSGKLSAGGTLALHRKQLVSATTLSTYLTQKKITLSDFAITVIAAAASS